MGLVFLKGELAVYVLVILALALRIHNFSATSIWSDEGITLDIIHKPLFEIFKGSFSDVNAPFYVLVTHVWALIFGYSLSAVRFF